LLDNYHQHRKPIYWHDQFTFVMIFFDIDQTLINHQHAQDAAVRLFWQKFSFLLPDSPEEFGEHWQAVMEKHFATFTRGEISFVEHRRRRIRELFQACLLYTSDAADEEL
jgi:FMN phosphatase YigB (HAD superfamily)